jgi:hypothetical protein
MPPKKKTTPISSFTLQQAKDFFNSRNYAENSNDIWLNAITTITTYNELGDAATSTTLTKKEQFNKFKNVNILPLIIDTDKVIDIINKVEHSKKAGVLISLETRKSYYAAILRLTDPPSKLKLDKPIRELYKNLFEEIAKESNDTRNLNKPKAAVADNPDFTWLVAQREYRDFIAEASFTNTQTGKKNLRAACGVGLYVLVRPRRIQDYASLQWYSKKPSPRDMNDRNILYADGDKMFISIDKFKTRYRTSTGRANKKKELLPRFEKAINPQLASLFKDYITKDKVGDMSKMTTNQRRDGLNYYIFSKDDDHKEMYEDNSFSKVMTGFFKHIYKRPKLSVNTFRHIYNTFLADNMPMINDKKWKEIAIEVGDTAKEFPTNVRYRTVNPEYGDIEKTVLEEAMIDNDYVKNLMIGDAEEEGSVGNVPQGDVDDVVSPTRQVPQTDKVGADEDLKVLYTRLGEAKMQVELIKSMIAKKLNF